MRNSSPRLTSFFGHYCLETWDSKPFNEIGTSVVMHAAQHTGGLKQSLPSGMYVGSCLQLRSVHQVVHQFASGGISATSVALDPRRINNNNNNNNKNQNLREPGTVRILFRTSCVAIVLELDSLSERWTRFVTRTEMVCWG